MKVDRGETDHGKGTCSHSVRPATAVAAIGIVPPTNAPPPKESVIKRVKRQREEDLPLLSTSSGGNIASAEDDDEYEDGDSETFFTLSPVDAVSKAMMHHPNEVSRRPNLPRNSAVVGGKYNLKIPVKEFARQSSYSSSCSGDKMSDEDKERLRTVRHGENANLESWLGIVRQWSTDDGKWTGLQDPNLALNGEQQSNGEERKDGLYNVGSDERSPRKHHSKSVDSETQSSESSSSTPNPSCLSLHLRCKMHPHHSHGHRHRTWHHGSRAVVSPGNGSFADDSKYDSDSWNDYELGSKDAVHHNAIRNTSSGSDDLNMYASSHSYHNTHFSRHHNKSKDPSRNVWCYEAHAHDLGTSSVSAAFDTLPPDRDLQSPGVEVSSMQANSSQPEMSDFRDIIDDLTVKNRYLKKRLRKVEKLLAGKLHGQFNPGSIITDSDTTLSQVNSSSDGGSKHGPDGAGWDYDAEIPQVWVRKLLEVRYHEMPRQRHELESFIRALAENKTDEATPHTESHESDGAIVNQGSAALPTPPKTASGQSNDSNGSNCMPAQGSVNASGSTLRSYSGLSSAVEGMASVSEGPVRANTEEACSSGNSSGYYRPYTSRRQKLRRMSIPQLANPPKKSMVATTSTNSQDAKPPSRLTDIADEDDRMMIDYPWNSDRKRQPVVYFEGGLFCLDPTQDDLDDVCTIQGSALGQTSESINVNDNQERVWWWVERALATFQNQGNSNLPTKQFSAERSKTGDGEQKVAFELGTELSVSSGARHLFSKRRLASSLKIKDLTDATIEPLLFRDDVLDIALNEMVYKESLSKNHMDAPVTPHGNPTVSNFATNHSTDGRPKIQSMPQINPPNSEVAERMRILHDMVQANVVRIKALYNLV